MYKYNFIFRLFYIQAVPYLHSGLGQVWFYYEADYDSTISPHSRIILDPSPSVDMVPLVNPQIQFESQFKPIRLKGLVKNAGLATNFDSKIGYPWIGPMHSDPVLTWSL